jgi:two-component system sensor histidine kinase KdpD
MQTHAIAPPNQHNLPNWLAVCFLLIVATAAAWALDPHVSLTSQAMLYVLVVVIASYKLDWVQSVACAVGAVTALNFFFVPPRWTFAVDSQEHFIALGTMLVVALVISRLATSLRRETATAVLNERRAHQLQGLATALANAASADQARAVGQTALDSAFAGPCALVTAQDATEFPNEGLDSAVKDGMLCCIKEGAVLGPGTGRWPGLDAWYLPLGDKGHAMGAACVRPALAADESGREHAQALCALVGQALLRLRMTQSMLVAQHEVQRQQVQSIFLAAISHDLRTPLAAIVGAASALQTQRGKLSPEEQDRLLRSMVSEASYLSTVTENTLQLVSLTNSAQALRRDWESMEEIVGSVLARLRQRDPDRRIKSKVPEGLPLMRVDPVLLAQLISNLLDNALKYSESPIELAVSEHEQLLEVSVKDRGPGIAVADRDFIFKPYARNDQSGQRGAGLGLALCRAIAEAHGGHLTYRPRQGGGCNFVLTLPIDIQPPVKELT